VASRNTQNTNFGANLGLQVAWSAISCAHPHTTPRPCRVIKAPLPLPMALNSVPKSHWVPVKSNGGLGGLYMALHPHSGGLMDL